MRLLGKALTFDDVLLVPAFSQVLPRDTSLATHFSRNIVLNLPLVSAAMDTVTEARLAITIAQEGGMGIVHKNLTPKQLAALQELVADQSATSDAWVIKEKLRWIQKAPTVCCRRRCASGAERPSPGSGTPRPRYASRPPTSSGSAPPGSA